MDRSSNAPRVSNGLAVMFCNAPLSDGAKVYFRSVTRLNPAAHDTLVKVERGRHMVTRVVNSSDGVRSPREVGVRQCEHAPFCLVTPWVTMWTLDVHSGDQ